MLSVRITKREEGGYEFHLEDSDRQPVHDRANELIDVLYAVENFFEPTPEDAEFFGFEDAEITRDEDTTIPFQPSEKDAQAELVAEELKRIAEEAAAAEVAAAEASEETDSTPAEEIEDEEEEAD